MSITLSQALSEQRTVHLHGRRISDMVPRGDLGLALDPDGPVGFALIRAWSRAGALHVLPQPLMLAVYGEGQAAAPDTPAASSTDERTWTMREDDASLRLDLHGGTLKDLLGRC